MVEISEEFQKPPLILEARIFPEVSFQVTPVHYFAKKSLSFGTLQTSGHESRNCYYFNELRQIKE